MKIKLREYLYYVLEWFRDHKSAIKTGYDIVVILLLITFITVLASLPKHATTETITTVDYGNEEQVAKLRESYKKAREMSTEDATILWFRVTRGCTYELGGTYRYKRLDCVGAYYEYFQVLGAAIPLGTVGDHMRRAEKLRAQGATFKITSIAQIKVMDTIIIRDSAGNPGHIAVVVGVTPSGLIQYVDMGGRARRAAMYTVPINDPAIMAIYSMTPEYFMGQ